MRTVTLSSGAQMPAIGLGTWESPHDKLCAATCHALKIGYRHLDLAAAYNNEKAVGEGLRKSGVAREELWITSKLWNDRRRPADVREAVATTMSDLGVDYLDLFLVHHPVVWKRGTVMVPDRGASLREAWQTLEQLVDEGKLRHLGVSNYNAAELRELLAYARVKPAVNQVEMHPRLPQPELLEFCRGQNIVVQAYSPLGRGRKGGILEHPAVQAAAASHGVGAGSVVLRWALERGVVVLPKSVTPKRIEANLHEPMRFELTAEETAAVDGLADGKRMLRDPWHTFPDRGIKDDLVRLVARALCTLAFTFFSLDVSRSWITKPK